METTPFPDNDTPTPDMDYDYVTPCEKVSVRAFGAQLLPPLYSSVFVVGLVGNILVILVLLQHGRLRNMTGIYLFNLAVSDLLFLSTLPFWIDYSWRDNWRFGNALCKCLSMAYHVGLYSEVFFIILLTLDRYLAIVHAVFALRARTVTFGLLTTGLAWAVAMVASVPEWYFSKTQQELRHLTCSLYYPMESQSRWRLFQALKLNLLGFLFPLFVMVVCYASIIHILLKRPNKKKAKAVRLIFTIMAIFFLFWTPYNLAVLVFAFQESFFTQMCDQSKQLDVAMQVTEVIANSHCCLNPIIYVFVGERFRKYLRQLFHRHVGHHLRKWLPFLSVDRLDRGSSTSPSTGEQELSAAF